MPCAKSISIGIFIQSHLKSQIIATKNLSRQNNASPITLQGCAFIIMALFLRGKTHKQSFEISTKNASEQMPPLRHIGSDRAEHRD
jgi:hypothetical protein